VELLAQVVAVAVEPGVEILARLLYKARTLLVAAAAAVKQREVVQQGKEVMVL
jgi:hypothetical protein